MSIVICPASYGQGVRLFQVSNTECIICQTCISTCPKKVLGLSFGFDMSKGDYLNRINQEVKVKNRLENMEPVSVKMETGKTE